MGDKGVEKQLEMLTIMSSILQSRRKLMGMAGTSYGGMRDLFEVLGFERNPNFDSYYWRYRRTSLGRRLITLFPKNCWRNFPMVKEDENPSEFTEFEKAWISFAKKHNVIKYLRKLDVLSGIGEYGVLLFGTNTSDFSVPMKTGEQLLYLRAFTSGSAAIITYDSNSNSPRYGLPEMYEIKFRNTTGEEIGKKVHYSRLIHCASDDSEEDEVFGSPRLEEVLNDLQGLDFILGGSAEMFWRGAYSGPVVEAREGNELPSDPVRRKEMEQEISDFTHGLKRFMKLQGSEAKTLPSNLTSPLDFFNIHISAICIAKNIPRRILEGSERGELASSEDRNNWAERVRDRQVDYCELSILRPFINACIERGFLPKPKNEEYSINWPSIQNPSGDQTAKIGKETAQAINEFLVGSAEDILPLPMFLTKYLQFTGQEIMALQEYWGERDREMEDDIANDTEIISENPVIEE